MGVPLSTACCCTVGDPDGCVEQLRTGRVVEQQAAAAGIASIARRKVQRRSQWMADAVPLLVQAVTRGESMDLREHAARALANLPMCDAANAQTIVDAGGVQALVYLLGVESYGCRAQAARALGNMCVVSKAAARKILHGGAVQPLLTALLTDEAPIAGINLSVEAAVALANFSSVDTHCRNAVLQSAVVIPGLQHLAASEDSQTKVQTGRPPDGRSWPWRRAACEPARRWKPARASSWTLRDQLPAHAALNGWSLRSLRRSLDGRAPWSQYADAPLSLSAA
ncbi:unnamed protein product [Effrenium voratum]|nr:unnamed protein product [Effrenium voratum]